jgi:hypothetical protein
LERVDQRCAVQVGRDVGIDQPERPIIEEPRRPP